MGEYRSIIHLYIYISIHFIIGIFFSSNANVIDMNFELEQKIKAFLNLFILAY